MKSLAVLAFLFCLPVARGQAVAGAPATIDYQGQVLDSTGNVLAAATPTNYTMQFRIYNQQTGGAIVWAESQVVTVDKGAFSVRLGQGVAIPASGGGNEGTTSDLRQAFNATDRYLGLTVTIPGQTPAEIVPRLAFLSSPFSLVAEHAKTADSVTQTSGTSTFSAATISSLTLGSSAKINGTSTFEFGAGTAGKQVDAGKIGYGAFTSGALDIVGAGTTNQNRKVQITAEGGLGVTGPLTVSGNTNISPPSSLSFGSTTRQMLNLYDSTYALGVQGDTLYSRSDSNFAWFTGGVHNNSQNNPGAGGTWLASLSSSGFNLRSGPVTAPSLVTTGNATIGGNASATSISTASTDIAAATISGSNGAGTWLALRNTSTGGTSWQWISTGSGNGEGPGKLLLTAGSSPNFVETRVLTAVRDGGNGRLGINNTNPLAPLHVSGSTFTIFNVEALLNTSGASDFPNLPYPVVQLGIIADGAIRASAFYVNSDSRIKNVVGRSDAAADLDTLRGIEVTDYTFKDRIGNGSARQKKVIAQQVESVYPQAVTKGTGVVPDIYRPAAVDGDWLELATDLKVGERVKLIAKDGEGVHEVLEVADGKIKTDFHPTTGKVFVYGREVDDFRSVDYAAISMLNVSATQELCRRNAALEKRVAELEIAREADRLAMDRRVTALEAQVTKLAAVIPASAGPLTVKVSAAGGR